MTKCSNSVALSPISFYNFNMKKLLLASVLLFGLGLFALNKVDNHSLRSEVTASLRQIALVVSDDFVKKEDPDIFE